jgi:enamine deaminase RidA (YjgF/YER057c/UK114 family)
VKDIVSTPDSPKAIGSYSQGLKANGFVFVSGQLPIDPATGELVEGGLAKMTERVMENLKGVLVAAGSSFGHVVRITIFLEQEIATQLGVSRMPSAAPPRFPFFRSSTVPVEPFSTLKPQIDSSLRGTCALVMLDLHSRSL